MPTPNDPGPARYDTVRSTIDMESLKREFLASVSHEMRTPLSVIMGYIQILKEETLGPLNAEQKKALETIYSRSEDFLLLMSHLLAARDIQDGKRHLKRDPLELRAFLAARLERPHRDKTRKNMTLAADLGVKEVWVQADIQKLGEVIDHLIINAFKFGPEGSAVRATLSIEGQNVSVSVQDSGPGLSYEARRKLFEPFSTAAWGLSRDHGGLGLGLFLCKEILDQHGGQILVDSPRGAPGCTVRFSLPLCAKPPVADTASRSRTRRVLVVEDDMDFLQLLVIFLGRLGSAVEVAAVESGAAALEEIERQTPDLVVLDLMLPGMDGLAILKRLKDGQKTSTVPVLIVSGYEAGARQASQAGAEDVLVKPFDEALFAAKATDLLNKNSGPKRR